MKHEAIVILLSLVGVAAMPAYARQVLAVSDRWAAFFDERADRCFAVSRPEPDGRARGEAAANVLAARRGGAPQFHIRLARPRAEATTATAEIDGRAFTLVGRGIDLWAPDARADAAMLAAMRGGGALRVRARAESGAAMSDRYPLAGFATALDAALIACAPQR